MEISVVKKVSQRYNLVVATKEDREISIAEVVVLRDTLGCGTNGIARLKSSLEAISPSFIGILPSCIKARLAHFEASGNLELVVTNHQLIVTKDESRQKSLPFAYLLRPSQRLEQMIEKSKSKKSFCSSQSVSFLRDSCICTLNIDKGGDDLNVSLRLANKERGNSEKDTHILASVGGPVSECFQNERETIFNPKYSLGTFLQLCTDHSYMVLSILPSNQHLTLNQRKCRSLVFLPRPVHGRCKPRKLKVNFIPNMVNEEDVSFSGLTSLNGGAP